MISATTSGGQNNAEAHSLCYDASGNRTRYRASLDGSVANCGSPAPSPAPTPTPTFGPAFSVSDASANEGESLLFTVTKTGSTSSTYTLDYATAPGTASTADYTTKSGTLTFRPSDTSLTVSVQAKLDIKTESTEVFYLNLSSPSGGATITRSQAVGSIYDVCGTC